MEFNNPKSWVFVETGNVLDLPLWTNCSHTTLMLALGGSKIQQSWLPKSCPGVGCFFWNFIANHLKMHVLKNIKHDNPYKSRDKPPFKLVKDFFHQYPLFEWLLNEVHGRKTLQASCTNGVVLHFVAIFREFGGLVESISQPNCQCMSSVFIAKFGWKHK